MEQTTAAPKARWLLLIHQIPPKPDYFRVKVRRRLQRIGAVALKNSVYVLPRTDSALEDFQWLWREIVQDGGEATVCDVAFVEGQSDEELEAIFCAERDAEYREIVEAAAEAREEEREGAAARLRRRLQEIVAVDYFGAPDRAAAEQAIAALEAGGEEMIDSGSTPGPLRGRTWVTREGVRVDRMSSAWLIRRFIDPDARFKFVPAKGYRPEAGELRFDMFEAEFTHEGDRCTFETLVHRFALRDPALRILAEIIHDLDCKDEKFARPETAGIGTLLEGIALAHSEDAARVERAAAFFDDLYAGLCKSAA